MKSFIIEFGKFGFGRDKGPPPALRLGLIRIWKAPFSLYVKLKSYEAALAASAEKLRGRGK